MTVFENLNSINVNDKVETKGRLKYLSWVYRWRELKKRYPNAKYTVYENADGMNYFTDGSTCWVKTGVEVEGIEYVEYLPVMDNMNRSIPFGKVTSFDVNKSIQRSITKRIRRHGLGLYIYAGEDLPERPTETKPKREPITDDQNADVLVCECCGKPIAGNVARRSEELFDGHRFCSKECRRKMGFKV